MLFRSPSEEDLDDKDIIKIVPKELQSEIIVTLAIKEEKKIPETPSIKSKATNKVIAKRRNFGKNEFNRSIPRRNTIKYIDMIDAWTQTSFHEEDTKTKDPPKSPNKNLTKNISNKINNVKNTFVEERSLLGTNLNYHSTAPKQNLESKMIWNTEDSNVYSRISPYVGNNKNSSFRIPFPAGSSLRKCGPVRNVPTSQNMFSRALTASENKRRRLTDKKPDAVYKQQLPFKRKDDSFQESGIISFGNPNRRIYISPTKFSGSSQKNDTKHRDKYSILFYPTDSYSLANRQKPGLSPLKKNYNY